MFPLRRAGGRLRVSYRREQGGRKVILPFLSSEQSLYQSRSQFLRYNRGFGFGFGSRSVQLRGMAAAAVDTRQPSSSLSSASASTTATTSSSCATATTDTTSTNNADNYNPPTTTTPDIIDNLITSHPITQSLRQNPSFQELRPHLSIPPALRPSHLVAGTLSGSEKITVAPYLWLSASSREVVAIVHLGREVCGHPGFIHGGLMAVLFDEVLCRCACACLPSGIGMTANLSVDYRSPGHPDRLYVLQAKTVDVQGRKAWVEGKMEMLLPSMTTTIPDQENGHNQHDHEHDSSSSSSSVLVAESKALFIEPKFAEVCIVFFTHTHTQSLFKSCFSFLFPFPFPEFPLSTDFTGLLSY